MGFLKSAKRGSGALFAKTTAVLGRERRSGVLFSKTTAGNTQGDSGVVLGYGGALAQGCA